MHTQRVKIQLVKKKRLYQYNKAIQKMFIFDDVTKENIK